MRINRFGYTLTFLLTLASSSDIYAQRAERSLQYFPEGRGFASYNGKNRYTRALYGGHSDFRLETSDRPVFATFTKKEKRNIQFFLHLADGKRLNFDELELCTA